MESITYGELKKLVASTPRGEWPSRVNPSLTRSQALDIFTASLNGHADDETLPGHLDLIRQNIQRECRSRA